MAIPTQPNIKLVNTNDYRESYSNSVQVRVNVWDFFLVFGTLQQQSETQVEVRNFQGIYLSPQQAKALMAILHCSSRARHRSRSAIFRGFTSARSRPRRSWQFCSKTSQGMKARLGRSSSIRA